MFTSGLHFASPFSHLAVDSQMDQKQITKIRNIFSFCMGQRRPWEAHRVLIDFGLRASSTLGIMKGLGESGSDSNVPHIGGGGFPANPDGKKEATFFCFPTALGEPSG